MTYIVWYSSMENDTHLFNSKLKLAWLSPIKSAEGTDTHDTLIIDSNLTGCNSNQTGCMVQKQWNEKIIIIIIIIKIIIIHVITMIIITIIIIIITIIIIIISRIVLNAYVLNIPPQTPLKSTKMQHRWTDRRTDIQFHETLKDLDPKDTYTSNFLNPHSHGHAVESIRKCIKLSENHTRFEGFNLKIDFKMPKMPKSHDRPLCPYLMRYDAVIPIKDLDPNDIYAKYHWNPFKTSQVIVRTPNTHERAPRFIEKSEKKSGKIQILKFSKTQDLYHVSPWALQTYQVWRL